jgi:hypothetical protein
MAQGWRKNPHRAFQPQLWRVYACFIERGGKKDGEEKRSSKFLGKKKFFS